MNWLEETYTFENHDAASSINLYGYSICYFFLFPLLGMAVLVTLARRHDDVPYWTLSLALTIDYLLSMPFFLVFPVPERWAYPESGAVLLSDQWSSRLIDAFRPMSALDNCFPSFHVSMTVAVVIACYLFRVRLRHAVAALGATIVLSTFALGIHWMGDIVAGVAVGTVSVALARRAVTAIRAHGSWPGIFHTRFLRVP